MKLVEGEAFRRRGGGDSCELLAANTAAGTQQPGKDDLGSPSFPPQDHVLGFWEGTHHGLIVAGVRGTHE